MLDRYIDHEDGGALRDLLGAPVRHPRRGRRCGFVLYFVLVLMALVTMMAFFLFRDLRHRDLWTHRHRTGEVALELANGAVSNAMFAIRNALEPIPHGGTNLEGGPLYVFLLQDPETLEKKFAEAGPGDQTAFMEKLLSEGAFDPVRRLLDRYPGADLQYRFELQATPLHQAASEQNPALEKYQDPVEKELTLTVEARVAYGSTTRVAWSTKSLRVYSLLPPFTPRFTACSLSSGNPNTFENDSSGRPINSGDPGPTRLYNDGELAQELGVSKPLRPGWLFFGTSPSLFKLTAGGSPTGQAFHLSSSGSNMTAGQPKEQPAGVESARPPVLGCEKGTRQDLWMQAAFWGYYKGMDPLNLFRTRDSDDRSSRLHLFGDASHPSPTRVIGPALQGLALYTDLAIDRDESWDDEEAQMEAIGIPLPRREAVDPFLRQVTAEQYGADQTREGSGRPSIHLIPFNSPGLPPFHVRNLNRMADLDGDGLGETLVSGEVEHSPLRLDPLHYRYGRLFGDFQEYDRWSSHEVGMAYGAVPDLMNLDPDSVFKRLSGQFVPRKSPIGFAEKIEDPATLILDYTDPLHGTVKPAESGRAHFDNQRQPDEDLPKFRIWSLVDTRAVIQMPPEELLGRYLTEKGGRIQLDLEGHAIRVLGTLEIPPGTETVGGGGGMLIAPAIRFAGDFRQDPAEAPVTVVTDRLEIADDATVELAAYASGFGTGRSWNLIGSLGTDSLSSLGQIQGAAISYQDRFDPTGPDAHLHYRADMSDRDLDAGTSRHEMGGPR